MRPAWPPLWVDCAYTQTEKSRDTETMARIGHAKIPPNEAARPFRTTGPDGRGDRGRSPRFT
jgi:hypothetical protein